MRNVPIQTLVNFAKRLREAADVFEPHQQRMSSILGLADHEHGPFALRPTRSPQRLPKVGYRLPSPPASGPLVEHVEGLAETLWKELRSRPADASLGDRSVA